MEKSNLCTCRDLAGTQSQRSDSITPSEPDYAKDESGPNGSTEQSAAASRARAVEHARSQQQKQYDELTDTLRDSNISDRKSGAVD